MKRVLNNLDTKLWYNRPKLGANKIFILICRKIIEAHSGEIGVESTIGKGTRFYFTLPLNFDGDWGDEEYGDVRF